MSVRGLVSVGALGLVLAACSADPDSIYFPPRGDPVTARLAQTLHEAAFAAGDDPARYSFALVSSSVPGAYSDDDATLYVTDGLLRMPAAVIDAVVAHEVAHEVLGHRGSRRALAMSLRAGFSVVGFVVPGAGLLDFVVNPIVVRAFSRQQELEADRKAVEILRALGYTAPRRAMAEALVAIDKAGGTTDEEPSRLLRALPPMDSRLSALEPLEAVPVARVLPRR